MQTIEVEDETWDRLAREGKKEELNVEEYLEKLVQVVREDTRRFSLASLGSWPVASLGVT